MKLSIQEILLLNAFVLFLIGLFGVITKRNIFKILLSINILQTGINLLLVGLGYVDNGQAPIITEKVNSLAVMVDPLPQALVLTSIVIGFGTTSLGLAITINYFKHNKTLQLKSAVDDEREMSE